MKRVFLLSIFVFFIGSIGLKAQVFDTTVKTVADVRSEGDNFGQAFSADEKYVYVGAPLADFSTVQSGAVHQYINQGSELIFNQTIGPDNPQYAEEFGAAVSHSGSFLFVGAPMADYTSGATVTDAGAVYVYKHTDDDLWGEWNYITTLYAPDPGGSDHFGFTVSVDGDYALIGAYQDSHDENDLNYMEKSGSAYIYKYNGLNWEFSRKIVANDRKGLARFGYSVSLDGDYAVIGAYCDSTDANDLNRMKFPGSAYIFKRNVSDNWEQEQKIVASDRAQEDYFGCSVSISGNRVIVGARNKIQGIYNQAGAAYIFEKPSSTWVQVEDIEPQYPSLNSYLGNSVDLSGDYAIIGYHKDKFNASGGSSLTDAGSAYIYKRDGTGNWSRDQILVANDRAAYDVFGTSVAIIDNNQAFVGAPAEDHDASGGNYLEGAGSLYLFHNNSPFMYLSVDEIELEFMDAQWGTFEVISNLSSWSASSSQSWATLNKLSGSNSDMVRVTADENTGSSPRTATITITGSGITRTLTVTQSANTNTLSVVPETLNIAAAANSTSQFAINSNLSTWTIVSSQTWLTVNPNSGSGNSTITVTGSENTGAARTATVTISGGGLNASVVVTQAAAKFLTVSQTALNIPNTAGSNTFTITSNTAWSISDNASWLTVSPTSGSNNSTITVSATENVSTVARSATVTITGTGVSPDKTVTITQAGAPLQLSVSTTAISVGAAANSNNTFGITSNTSWTVSGNKTWLSIAPASGSGNETITVTATTANNTVDPRTATVTVLGTGGLTRTVTVTQSGVTPVLTVAPTTLSVAALGGTNDFDITSNLPTWSVASNQTWLTVSAASGSYNKNITVTATANPSTTASRTATVTVSSSYTTSKTVTITQPAASPELDVSSTTLNLGAAINSTGTFSIYSNTSWSVAKSESWLTISSTTGSGDKTLTVTATQANSGTASRTATITVSATGATDQTILVTQLGTAASLLVSPTETTLGAASGSVNYLTITSNISWTVEVTSGSEWMTAGPSSGTGNSTITARATSANPSTSATRSAEITVSGAGVADVIINVTQEAQDVTFSVSPTELNLGAGLNSSDIFYISSNISWTVSSDESWLSVSAASGSGDGTITVIAEENTSLTTDRTANVTVTGGGVSEVVTVTQAMASPELEISTTSLGLENEEGSANNFDISSNTSWTVTSDKTWLTAITPASGTGDANIEITASENASADSRIATLTISAPGLSDKYITVTQIGTSLQLVLNPTDLSVGAEANSSAVFNITSNVSWTVSSNQPWLSMNVTSGSNNSNVTVIAAEYTSLDVTREATVTVTGGGLTEYVTVKQQKATPVLSVSTNSLGLESADGSNANFNITTNTTWSISGVPAWLTLNASSGSGDDNITVTASENTSTSTREATLTITAPGISGKMITVTQLGSDANLIVSPSIITLSSAANSQDDIDIVSNVSWTVSSNKSWLSASVSSGTNSGNVTVTAQANTGSGTRTAIVTIEGGGYTKTVNVTQDGTETSLVLSAEGIIIDWENGSTNSFTITTNASWVISGVPTWFTLNKSNGIGNANIIVTASQNDTPSEREVTLTIDGPDVDPVTIVVKQRSENSITAIDKDAILVRKAYPNPFEDQVLVELDKAYKQIHVRIYTYNGTLIAQQKFENQDVLNVETSGLIPGVYVMSVNADDHSYRFKLMKNK